MHPYKKIIAALILVAFLMQAFSRSFIVIDYYINTAAYAQQCENKARPEMHCNGKCQMMKKIKAEDKKDQQQPERKFENKNEITLSASTAFPTLNAAANTSSAVIFPHFNCLKEIKISHSIFHPPTV